MGDGQSRYTGNVLLVGAAQEDSSQKEILDMISGSLEGVGYRVVRANSKEAIERAGDCKDINAAIIHLVSDEEGEEFGVLKAIQNDVPCIMLSGKGNPDPNTAVESMRGGAFDYLNQTEILILPNALERVIQRFQNLKQNEIKDLERRIIIDEKTGLFNEKHFRLIYEKEVNRAMTYGSLLGLLFFDLDNFSKLNEYSREMADNVLGIVGKMIKETLRGKEDQASRWGGDEFTILVPGINIENAVRLAERIKGVTNNYDWGKIDPITASFGVACLDPHIYRQLSQREDYQEQYGNRAEIDAFKSILFYNADLASNISKGKIKRQPIEEEPVEGKLIFEGKNYRYIHLPENDRELLGNRVTAITEEPIISEVRLEYSI